MLPNLPVDTGRSSVVDECSLGSEGLVEIHKSVHGAYVT